MCSLLRCMLRRVWQHQQAWLTLVISRSPALRDACRAQTRSWTLNNFFTTVGRLCCPQWTQQPTSAPDPPVSQNLLSCSLTSATITADNSGYSMSRMKRSYSDLDQHQPHAAVEPHFTAVPLTAGQSAPRGRGQHARQQANAQSADNLAAAAAAAAAGKVKMCMQCGTTKTPQWREGPLGPKTLCNACGMCMIAVKVFQGESCQSHQHPFLSQYVSASRYCFHYNRVRGGGRW